MPGFKSRAWAAAFWLLATVVLVADSLGLTIWLAVTVLCAGSAVLAAAYHLAVVTAGLLLAAVAALAVHFGVVLVRGRRHRGITRGAKDRDGAKS